MSDASSGLQLRSLLKKDGQLEVSLMTVPTPEPAADEVVVRVEAAPINPSDLGLLFGAADPKTIRIAGSAAGPIVTATVPEKLMPTMAGRVGESMAVGGEGGGVVIKAGTAKEAQALLGKTVGMLGGSMYSQYRTLKVGQCLPLPDGTTPMAGASCFVNPLTALAMVETMRREGHTALVHTAAASNLGQMLNRICLEDGVELVNIVRRPEQEAILRKLGAKHVVNSSAPSFLEDLTKVLATTGATIAFDATGGGKLGGQILSCMEVVAVSKMKEYNRYGSSTFKQLYIYGRLDVSPSELVARNLGFAWAVGGFLVTPSLAKLGAEGVQRLRARVVAGLETTFASHYTKVVSLAEALSADALAAYTKIGTGEKYLINPHKS